MHRSTARPCLALCILSAVVFLSAPARALEGTCQPVFDAMTRTATMPTHVYITLTSPFRAGGKPTTSETIYAGGAIYVKVNGQWIRSAITPEEMLQREEESLARGKAACRSLHEAFVEGEAATVYSAHSETQDEKKDVRVWISKGKGLPLREELDLDMGGTLGKSHRSMRYEYGNVQPPL